MDYLTGLKMKASCQIRLSRTVTIPFSMFAFLLVIVPQTCGQVTVNMYATEGLVDHFFNTAFILIPKFPSSIDIFSQ
jgi:hypothetical protein